MPFSRPHQFQLILSRLRSPRRFIQVLAGPRQSGKTTLATQALKALEMTSHYASADEPSLKDNAWVEAQWDIARIRSSAGRRRSTLLVLDEVQKIPGWSEVVKRLWDEDSRARRPVKVLLLGSSPLMMQSGLTESLAGRFELIPVPHWSFAEMRDGFGWDLNRFLYFRGYPGAAALVRQQQRWRRYIVDRLIETALSRDILLLTRVDKPALLRQLFQLGCDFSGQILSYNKMLGQLQDAGNTTTLAHLPETSGGGRTDCGHFQIWEKSSATTKLEPQASGAQHRSHDRNVITGFRGGTQRSRVLGSFGRKRCRCPPTQQCHWNVYRDLLLARTGAGGGFRRPARQDRRRLGGQERSPARSKTRPRGVLAGVQANAKTSGGRRRDSARGVLIDTARTLSSLTA